MRLTPLDIRKQEFRKAMRGLDGDEVYAFLSTVADEYEALLNDNKALRERLVELDDKVQEYRNMEKTLRDTLLTAERVTVEAKDNAKREAELIIKEAQLEAQRGVSDVRTNAMKLRQEVLNLKRERDSYLARMKMLVASHLKFIENADKDFAAEDARIEAELAKSPAIKRPSQGGPKDARPKPTPRVAPAPPRAPVQPAPAWERPAPGTDGREAAPTSAPKTEPTPPRPVRQGPPRPAAYRDPTALEADAPPIVDEPQSDWTLDRLKKDIASSRSRDDSR